MNSPTCICGRKVGAGHEPGCFTTKPLRYAARVVQQPDPKLRSGVRTVEVIGLPPKR